MTFDLKQIRAHFPALSRPVVFLDNPGGTQVANGCLERMHSYLVDSNANHGGAFETSRASDALVELARAAMADFINAANPSEIIFGANMTTLTFAFSRALVRTFQPGDTILVTRLDHEANISPWLLAAEDRGCIIRWVDIHPEDCTLDLEDFQKALEMKPRLVAFGFASNAVGTINPVRQLTELAHAAGALVYVDAVHYVPHGPVDVRALGVDFLVCSAYKFFGPHLGILYGRAELLQNLRAYRVRPAPVDPPGKFETGTGNFEAMAGLLGALEYYEWLGNAFGVGLESDYAGRPLVYKQAQLAVQTYEAELTRRMLAGLQGVPGLTIYGITAPDQLHRRVPTFSFTLAGQTPRQVAERLGASAVQVWDGNFYALAITERLDLEKSGGMVRVGALHYNTLAEIDTFIEALK
jgi:cysteine desulfurase family protein (TIGR01976 family)